MAIVATDIKWYRTGDGTLNGSLGGAATATEWAAAEKLFGDVTGTQSQAGITRYRAVTVKNTHATLTLSTVKLWVNQDTDTEIDIAIVATKNTAPGSIGSETSAPAGITFTGGGAHTSGTALTIPDLAPGDYQAVWIRSTVTSSHAAVNESWSVEVDGDTPA